MLCGLDHAAQRPFGSAARCQVSQQKNLTYDRHWATIPVRGLTKREPGRVGETPPRQSVRGSNPAASDSGGWPTLTACLSPSGPNAVPPAPPGRDSAPGQGLLLPASPD